MYFYKNICKDYIKVLRKREELWYLKTFQEIVVDWMSIAKLIASNLFSLFRIKIVYLQNNIVNILFIYKSNKISLYIKYIRRRRRDRRRRWCRRRRRRRRREQCNEFTNTITRWWTRGLWNSAVSAKPYLPPYHPILSCPGLECLPPPGNGMGCLYCGGE